MTKKAFLKKLRYKLCNLKREERNKYIEYYDEIISDIMDGGVSESEAIERQGSIEQIAKDILSGTSPINLKRKSPWGAILATISTILLLCSCAAVILMLQMKKSFGNSVGIIGGADGPTAIFVAGNIGQPWSLYIVTAVVVIITVLYFAKKYRE